MSDTVQKSQDEIPALTEITEAHIPRVDGVLGPANGMPFLIVKNGATPQPDAAALAAAPGAPVTQPAAVEPVVKADGEEQPGSPAWEEQDAANLKRASELIVEARKLVQTAVEREERELWDGDEDAGDWDAVCNLYDALYAIECGLANVAMQAAIEEGEAGAVTKSKPLTPRATEVLRKGIASLQELLDRRSTSKETPMSDVTKAAETPAAETTETPAAVAEEQPVAETGAAAAPVTEEKAEKAAEATTTDTPAPAPSLADVVKSAEFADVLKSVISPVVEAAVKPLEDRIEKMEQQPQPGGPFLRGRGDDEGKDITELIKARDAERDPQERAMRGQELALAVMPPYGPR